MKNLFVFFLFLFIAASSNAQWQSEVRLTNDPFTSYNSGNSARCIATNGDVVHVVWYDGYTINLGNWEIYYKRSTDRGLTWSANVNLSNNEFLSYNPVIAVSGSYIYVAWHDRRDGNFEEYYKRSTDEGITWGPEKRLTNNTGISKHPSISASGLNVHLVWFDNSDGPYEIYYKNSIDGGDTWSEDLRLSNTVISSYLPAVAVSGSFVHVAWYDDFANIYYKRSTDGGINWGADTLLSNNSATSQYPTLAVSGSIVHLMWVDYSNGTGNIYYKRSVDGGSSWDPDTCLFEYNFYSPSLAVTGSDVHLVFYSLLINGYDIMYIMSNNDGVNWGNDAQLTDNTSNSVVPSIAVSGSAVHVIFRDDRDGNTEIYYKRYIDTTTSVEQEEGLPTAFKLMQNYPNPFNPTTTISYQIPVAGYVSLKVYDLLGRAISTLVNGELEAGYHEVNFDASASGGLPSGVYLYQLKTGEFIQTKELVLLK